MSIFPPLLDVIKDLSDLFQCFINFLGVHLPAIVSTLGKLVQVVHCPHPRQRIALFQILVDTLCLGHLAPVYEIIAPAHGVCCGSGPPEVS